MLLDIPSLFITISMHLFAVRLISLYRFEVVSVMLASLEREDALFVDWFYLHPTGAVYHGVGRDEYAHMRYLGGFRVLALVVEEHQIAKLCLTE